MSHRKQRINLDKIRSDAKNQREAVSGSIRAAAEPLFQLPASIEVLRSQGRSEEIEKLEVLAKTVAQDIDSFSKEFESTNESFKELEQTPFKPKQTSQRFTQYMDYGFRFMTLNERVLGTAAKAANQMSEILLPEDTVQGETNE